MAKNKLLSTENKCSKYLKAALCAVIVFGVGMLLRKLDWNILYFFQNYIRNPILDIIVPFYTTLGEWAICWIVIGLIMLPFKKYRKCGFLVLVSLLVGLLICNIALKNLVARDRPCYLIDKEIWENTIKLVGNPSEYSFPSGHSVSSMSAALMIYFNHKKLGIAALVAAVLMGLSRLYVFVHFPTDVFGGFIIGAAISVGVWLVYKKIESKRSTETEA